MKLKVVKYQVVCILIMPTLGIYQQQVKMLHPSLVFAINSISTEVYIINKLHTRTVEA